MSVVFTSATISRCWSMARSLQRRAGDGARRQPGAGSLSGRGGPRDGACSRSRACTPTTTRATSCTASRCRDRGRARSSACSGATARVARPRSRPSWGWCRRPAGAVRLDGVDLAGERAFRIARGGHRLRAGGARDLRQPDGRREPSHRHAGGARRRAGMGVGADVRLLPAAQGAPQHPCRTCCRAASSRC